MGDSTKACNWAGRVSSSLAGSAVGLMTPTVGMASLSVSLARARRSEKRRMTVNPPARKRTSKAITASRAPAGLPAGGPAWVCDSVGLSRVSWVIDVRGFLQSILSFLFRRRSRGLFGSVHNAEDHGHEKQSGDCGKNQAADHRSAQRS